MKTISMLLVLLLGFIQILPLPALMASDEEDTEETGFDEEESILYRFEENLSVADAFIRVGTKKAKGVSKGNGIVFDGFGKGAEITLTPVTIEGAPYQGIIFNPVSDSVRQLRFSDVPPASQLHLHYRLEHPEGGRGPLYLYLRIWIGRKQVARIPLQQLEDGAWVSERLDLGIFPFMNRSTTLTFELSGEHLEGMNFTFVSKIN